MTLAACGGAAPTAAATEDPWAEMLAIAKRDNRDLLLRLEQEPAFHIRGESGRHRAFDTLVANGAPFGVTAFAVGFVDEPEARHVPGLARIPEPARGVVLPFPSSGALGDEPPGIGFDVLLPLHVFVDASGQPFATLECDVALDDAELRARIERARAVRRSRDEAFAAAATATGKERIAALQRGLAALERWLVVRCHAAELAELVASGDASSVEFAQPLLREHRVLQSCRALRTASEGSRTVDPRRLRRQLDEVVLGCPDLPEVALLAHCVQASAELRLAIDRVDRDRIVARVRAATDAAGTAAEPFRAVARVWIGAAASWQPR